MIAQADFYMSDEQILRQRSVYNIVDLIADTSGIADILLVTSILFMTVFFTNRNFVSQLLRHVSYVQLKESPVQGPELFNDGRNPHHDLICRVFKEISMRGHINLTYWQTLVVYYLPRKWRTDSQNKLFDLARSSMNQFEKRFDVRHIIDQQVDIENLMSTLVSSQRLWLMRQSKSNIISSKEVCPIEELSDKSVITKLF